jgi:FKBP-type peptidyl-prolyl cis-trans isomerase (trigger factor)
MQQKSLLIAIIGILVVAVGAWFFFSNGGPPSQDEMPDLSDTAARVNGEDITRTELESSEAQIAAQQGIDAASLDTTGREQLQEQALDGLIENTLIQQAAANSGLTATEADVDTQIELLKGQFSDDAQFQEALIGQGLSEADLREQVRGEVVVQAYLEQTLDLASITVTDEEITALYEQESAVTEDIPPLEDVRGQIESFVIQQKQQELLAAHVQELRSNADIEILI